jgi:hypothetical protein
MISLLYKVAIIVLQKKKKVKASGLIAMLFGR